MNSVPAAASNSEEVIGDKIASDKSATASLKADASPQSSAAETTQQVAPNLEVSAGSKEKASAKVQGLIGMGALTLANAAELLTHLDQIRDFTVKSIGPEWMYRLHSVFVWTLIAVLAIGFLSSTYWLYHNFFITRRREIKIGFVSFASALAIASVVATYLILRPIDYLPSIKLQAEDFKKIVYSQQKSSKSDDGGFQFSRKDISEAAQAWTTAQCLVALLKQDQASLFSQKQSIARAFKYLDRVKISDGGWGYQSGDDWSVTEVDAWGALAYIYGLRVNKKLEFWNTEEIRKAKEELNELIRLLVDREHTDGGWSVIEKTENPRHLRTYSTLMAVWALAEANMDGYLVDNEQSDALTRGEKYLLSSKTISPSSHFAGWWPNPAARDPGGISPGLTAQVLFVLTIASKKDAFIEADDAYRDTADAFSRYAVEGIIGDNHEAYADLSTRDFADNDRATDSDRYLEGRKETAEQSTFLWGPWSVAFATVYEEKNFLNAEQKSGAQHIIDAVLARYKEEGGFSKNYEVIYPVAEELFSDSVYLENANNHPKH